MHDPVTRPIVEGEVVPLADVMPRPLQFPPAVRQTCACGKDGSDYAHGGTDSLPPFTCAEVLAIRARVEDDQRREQRPGRVARLFRRGGAQ